MNPKMIDPEISKLMKEMRETAEKAISKTAQVDEQDRQTMSTTLWTPEWSDYRSVASAANILKLLDYFEREAKVGHMNKPITLPEEMGFMCPCCGHKNFKNGPTLCDYCFRSRMDNSTHRCKPDASPEPTQEAHDKGCPYSPDDSFGKLNSSLPPAPSLERVELPPLPVPYRQEPPVYSMILVQQRDKWKKKWTRMDDEYCAQHHYKHYEWECRKVFEELEARERQLLAEMKVSAGLRRECEAWCSRAEDFAVKIVEQEERAEKAEAELQSLRERKERALACLRCSEDKKHAKMAITILTQPEHSTDEGKEPKQ